MSLSVFLICWFCCNVLMEKLIMEIQWREIKSNQIWADVFPMIRCLSEKPCSKSVFQESNGIIDRISPEEDSRQFAERWKDSFVFHCHHHCYVHNMCHDRNNHHSAPHCVPREIESGLHYNVCTNFAIEMALHWMNCNNRENESNCDICANYLRRDWRGICSRHSTCREFAS